MTFAVRVVAACVAAVIAHPLSAQVLSDRMLCELIDPCGDEPCEGLDAPLLFSLELVDGTWLWDPLAEWNGFPVAVAETLTQAEALAQEDTTEVGLILVPMGHTEDGALILDGYGFQYFPTRGLAPRAMRHHCAPVGRDLS
ncbi:hypothetical protein [Gymnodinialimonas hymeniacidonis]|uniref:hypothetical protein n=1 Tax=Gymnodinialimonas hymeniacidonis TaxID=3126508 RepID=UPI0034C6476E